MDESDVDFDVGNHNQQRNFKSQHIPCNIAEEEKPMSSLDLSDLYFTSSASKLPTESPNRVKHQRLVLSAVNLYVVKNSIDDLPNPKPISKVVTSPKCKPKRSKVIEKVYTNYKVDEYNKMIVIGKL